MSNESGEFIRISTNVQVGSNAGNVEPALDKITIIFTVALPAVCVKNKENWHIRMQFLHNETREHLEISMIDTLM
jgi:hypothetical protein